MEKANAERNDAITKAAAVSLIWILAGLEDGMSEKYDREKGKIHVNLTPLAQP